MTRGWRAGRAPDVTELGAGNIGGMTLTPGVYKWGTGLLIPTDVTLSGSATAVWIFQIAQNLTMSSGVKVVLAGGAQIFLATHDVGAAQGFGRVGQVHQAGVIGRDPDRERTGVVCHRGAFIGRQLEDALTAPTGSMRTARQARAGRRWKVVA